uniref:Uncharacterized protein n=1 Tax=Parascaris univalens TaxID=6257 RepID=A0A914ZH04_PARUN
MLDKQSIINGKDTLDSANINSRSRGSSYSATFSMLDVLQKHYDIVKALAELDRCETSSVCSSASIAFDEGGSADSIFNGEAASFESLSSPQRRKSDPLIWPSASKNQRSLESKTDVWHRIGDNFNSYYKNIVEAFAETNEDLHYQNLEPRKLSAHALRRDIRRCRKFP